MNAPSVPHVNKGFSLVEMLVVLAVVAILAALVFSTGRGMILRVSTR
jgi:prepilin-type N-terminal cleavage/methylation domain-containing protein